MNSPETILRMRKVIERTGLSRATIHRKVRSGDFPSPVTLGPNAIGWHQGEVAAWIASRPRVNQSYDSHDDGRLAAEA